VQPESRAHGTAREIEAAAGAVAELESLAIAQEKRNVFADDIAAAVAGEVDRKWAGHAIGQVHFLRPSKSMSQLGG
jgi:hypothetical protein